MPSLPQAQLTLVVHLGATSTHLCSCLPALPTHLAVLRLLQAKAAGVDLAFSLWIDLDELIALGVPAGLGRFWGTLSRVTEGLGSVQKSRPPHPSPTILRSHCIPIQVPISSSPGPWKVPRPSQRGRSWATHPSWQNLTASLLQHKLWVTVDVCLLKVKLQETCKSVSRFILSNSSVPLAAHEAQRRPHPRMRPQRFWFHRGRPSGTELSPKAKQNCTHKKDREEGDKVTLVQRNRGGEVPFQQGLEG